MILRFWSIFGRMLNLGPSEGPHVFIAWIIGLFARISFGLGWTVMIVYFVSHYGVHSLPYLFVIHALGMVCGSFLFSNIVNRFKKEYLLISLVLGVALTLVSASISFVHNSYIFLGLVFLALSVLHSQLKIVHSLFVEELFTPTQSNRVFPIIESSETIGIIFGGLLISSLSHILPLNKFLYIWIMCILLVIPAIIMYVQHSISIPFVDLVKERKVTSRIKTLKSVFRLSKRMKFVQSIVVIVFLQWAFFSILEFQFTKAVEQSVNHNQEETLVLHELNEFGKASVVIAQSDVSDVQDSKSFDSKSSYDEDFEERFAADLGNLQILFGGITLLFQLLLASRILTYLGVVGSMLISPIVLLVSIIFMTLKFGFGSAIVARFNHELANVLHMNAYHSSYYVLSHEMRASVKELLEGFVRPIGALFGTTVLLGVTYLFSGETATLALNIVAFFIILYLLFSVIKLKDRYKRVPRNILRDSNSLNELINAVSIIRQNGKESDLLFLIEIYNKRNDLPHEVREQIIDTIGFTGDTNHLSFLINQIETREDMRLNSLRAVNSIFAKYYPEISEKPFTLYALRNLYQKLLKDTSDPILKGEVISFVIMSNYHEGFVDQIVQVLDNDLSPETLTSCSSVLKDLDDQHIVNFVQKFLKHDNPKVKSVIIDVIWPHLLDKTNAITIINEMLETDDEIAITEALFVLLNLDTELNFDSEVVATLKRNKDKTSVQFLGQAYLYISGYNDDFYEFVYMKLPYKDLVLLSPYVDRIENQYIKKLYRKRVTSEIHELYMHYNKYFDDSDSLSEIQRSMLVRLRELYKIIGAEKEYFTVEEILRST